ncbi:hypothetical protein [Streptomyces iranensis]|uniref:hypothetical protein n=1 Tax=Streptomyces iranensis TaxID=576784 RepID=UPI0039B7779F
MVTVTRTRLDNGTLAIVRATATDLDIAIDERHITAAGATAIEHSLNNVSARHIPGPRQTSKSLPAQRRAS